MSLRLRRDDAELSLISTTLTFETAADVTVSELAIEASSRAHSQTADRLAALATARLAG